MSARQKKVLSIMGGVVAGLLVGFLLLGGKLIPVLVGAVIGALVGAVIGSFFHDEIRDIAGPAVGKVMDQAREVVRQVATPNLSVLREQLIAVELSAATAGLSETVRTKLAEVTTRLEPVMTGLTEGYPGHELTWLACRIAERRLSEVVTPFARMSPESRNTKEAEIIGALDALLGHIAQCEKVLKGSTELDAETAAAHIKVQFDSAAI